MKQHILCFGDSNTHGYCATPQGCADQNGRFNEEERWTKLLQTALGDDHLVIEEGLSGRTTVFDDPLHGGLRGLDYLPPCLMSHQPIDLLVIMLGTNDTKERFGASAPCIGLGMRRLVELANTIPCWRTTPNILIVSPPPILDGMHTSPVAHTMGEGCAAKSRQLADIYKQLATDLGCHYMDGAGCQHNHVDFMHLTREGHRELADKFIATIPNLLP